jgi:prephenate dehydrogenase
MNDGPPVWDQSDSDCRAAVIGLGLIGGSFAAALRFVRPRWAIVGYDRDETITSHAISEGWIHQGVSTIDDAVRDADVVVLATPVGVILEILGGLGRLVSREAVVIDVGSTKSLIADAMSALPHRLHAIGGHPMTGQLTTGSSRPSDRLFAGQRFVLTPTARTRPSTLDWSQRLLRDFGAEAVVMDPRQHDEAVALTSHLPYLISLPLLELFAERDDATQSLAAGGFQSRVDGVAANQQMWRDILQTNRHEIARTLSSYAEHLAALERDLREGSEDVLQERLEQAARSASKVPRAANRQP